jgi:hypothetical protein
MFHRRENPMYRVKVRTVGVGQHPSEAVVSVTTADGKQEELIVDRRSLEGKESLRVGYPLRRDGDQVLIELPRETMRGSWRIWVKGNDLESEERAA